MVLRVDDLDTVAIKNGKIKKKKKKLCSVPDISNSILFRGLKYVIESQLVGPYEIVKKKQ